MSTLAQQLDRRREASAAKIPLEAKAVMARATQELRDSGLAERVPGVGQPFPHFELEDTDGSVFRSQEAVADGPLVVSVYRGVW